MFLISLLIFPCFAYFFFEKFKGNTQEMIGILKVIGIVGLALLHFFLLNNFFHHQELMLMVILWWYFIVYVYFYYRGMMLLLSHIQGIKIADFSLELGIMKIGILLFLMGAYISIIDKIQYGHKGILWFFVNILPFVAITEIFDMTVRNTIRKKQKRLSEYSELKAEIIAELLKSEQKDHEEARIEKRG